MPRSTYRKVPAVAAAVEHRRLLSIGVMNGLSLRLGGDALPLANRKARAILAFLALENAPAVPRERLASLFWSESAERHARNSLRQTLFELREALSSRGSDVIVTENDDIGLNPALVEVDLDQVLTGIAEGRVPELPSGADTLLSGYETLSPDFGDWLAGIRRGAQNRLARALETAFHNVGLPAETRRHFAEAALRIEPVHEEAARTLMRLAAEAGEIGVALRVYATLYDAMGRDLDMEPSEATEALVADIKLGRIALAAEPARPVEASMPESTRSRALSGLPGGIPVVAVLPLRAVGSDEATGWVADAIAEDLVRGLASLREPAVISSNSTRVVLTEGLDIPRLGERLGAGYLVTGSVRQAGPAARVTVELSQASSGTVLWSDAYKVATSDVFDAVENIASSVANQLGPQVNAAELRRSLGQPPQDLSAYHLLLRARELVFRMAPDSLEEAGRLIKEAIRRDPGYAGAYVGQAFWYGLRMFQGWSPDRLADANALMQAVTTAIRLDPHYARAMALLGHHLMLSEHRYEEAELMADRAVAAGPNDAEVLINSTLPCAYRGRTADALERAERALLLSPQDPLLFRAEHFLSITHFAAEDLEKAAFWGLRAWQRKPDYTSNLRFTAAALAGTGRVSEAQGMARHHLRLQPNQRAADIVSRLPFKDNARQHEMVRLLTIAGLP